MTAGRHEVLLASIREYHERFHPDQRDETPATVTPELLDFRRMLLDEESAEALDALDDALDAAKAEHDTTEPVARLVHELADVVIVAYGTAMRVGVDLDDVMRLVMSASHGKVPNPDPAGKALKPADWVPADGAVLELVRRSAQPASVRPFVEAVVEPEGLAPAGWLGYGDGGSIT